MIVTRRKFIKNAGIMSAAAALIPSFGLDAMSGEDDLRILQNFILKGFDDEQEEYPALVGDGNGELWMFSLRRLPYPDNKELVSAFRFDGSSWNETDLVTKNPGQFEAPVAACAVGGKPVVAWTSIDSGKWTIKVSRLGKNGFEEPDQLKTATGRAIDPVLIAPARDRYWIAWENLHEGRLQICISKYESGKWKEPMVISKGENSCFNPAIAEAGNGDLCVAYGVTHGYHQNIEMAIIDGRSLRIKKTVPIAVGGGLKNRVNLNTKPALTFDEDDRLWISYENNRNASRLDDGDNYTGDRCCAILTYQNGRLLEPELKGKWLFSGKNDHKPTFIKDNDGRLYLATHCGGNFTGQPHWQYRLSWLDPQKGWVEPVTILKTAQKGAMIPPAIAFDKENSMWLATSIEKRFDRKVPEGADGVVCSRLAQLTVNQFATPAISKTNKEITFRETQVREYLPGAATMSLLSGHPRVTGEQMILDDEVYTLIYGNLHEHSENSPCWPAGTDGTLHDDYRFGMFSEGYDFVGITDHGYSLTEVYWRKNLRLADFYNEPNHFVAIPAMEWTLRSDKQIDGIQYGAGHYNVIFKSAEEGRKFIRNQQEIFSVYCPETNNAAMLWKLLHEKDIDCITIPHHPADETHPVDWDVHDDHYVPVVELFQCRGNSEYPGCPREINLERHRTTKHKRAFINYALKEKKIRMGFIASGDHNSMGVGVAALWVKELTRDGILDALKSRRCFATTGDKMIIDFRINGSIADITVNSEKAPALQMKIKGQRELDKIEILRNSEMIKTYTTADGTLVFDETFVDEDYRNEKEVLYYYIRATQKNGEIGWSSPIWIELS